MNYLKRTLIVLAYMLMTFMTGMAISYLGSLVVSLALSIVNVVLFALMNGIAFHKFGEEDMKALYENDLLRRRIVETGDAIEINKSKEFKKHKPFIIATVICAPLLILMVLHLILAPSSGGETVACGSTSGFLYMVFFQPVSCVVHLMSYEVFKWQHYLFLLYAYPAMILILTVPYCMGAAKVRKQRNKIEEKQKGFYGDRQ